MTTQDLTQTGSPIFGAVSYIPDYCEYRFQLDEGVFAKNYIADTSWGQSGGIYTIPDSGTTITVDYWYRYPWNYEVESASWCTPTLQLASGNGANCSSFLLDAGTYSIYMNVSTLYGGRISISLDTDSTTSKATALSGVIIYDTNNYAGHVTDPGDTNSNIQGYFTLAIQTRVYVHRILGNVNINYANGVLIDRIGRPEINATLLLTKFK